MKWFLDKQGMRGGNLSHKRLKMTAISTDNHVPSQTKNDSLSVPSPQEEQEELLEVSGTLRISDYVHIEPAKPETINDLTAWTKQQRESTRSRLSILLLKFFGASLAGTFLLVSIAVFQPDVDKTAIKDLVPLIITPQVTLLGVALGFYFGAKDD